MVLLVQLLHQKLLEDFLYKTGDIPEDGKKRLLR